MHRPTTGSIISLLLLVENAACFVQFAACSTVVAQDRALPVAAAKVWNMLPPAITSLSSLEAFKRALKTELFRRSYGNAHYRQQ